MNKNYGVKDPFCVDGLRKRVRDFLQKRNFHINESEQSKPTLPTQSGDPHDVWKDLSGSFDGSMRFPSV